MLKQWSLESVHYAHGYQNIEKSDVHNNFTNWVNKNYEDEKIKIRFKNCTLFFQSITLKFTKTTWVGQNLPNFF